MGNLCQTPAHEDAARFSAETNQLRKAKLASTIASDYESWKYLRRAIKWYNAYQQCMACYLFLQFEENFKRRMDTVMCDSEELDCRQRDQLINHAQEARNMYAYSMQLVEKYRKDNFQDPPELERPSRLTQPRWAMWINLLSASEEDDGEDGLEDMLERMGVLKKQSRKTQMRAKHKAKEAAAATSRASRHSTTFDFKPSIHISPTISPNTCGGTANPTVAQSGSSAAAGGAAAAASHGRTAAGGSSGGAPSMQPIQTPNGLLYPVMTSQGLMYVPGGSSSAAAAAGVPPSDPGYAYAPSAPPLAPRTPAPYAQVWV